MLVKKALEYADGNDRLHNFRVAAAISGDPMKKVLAGMMVKHTTSVYDMCHDLQQSFSEEMWNEKITDHINDLLLLGAVIFEEEGFGEQEATDMLDHINYLLLLLSLASFITYPSTQPTPLDDVDTQFESNDHGK